MKRALVLFAALSLLEAPAFAATVFTQSATDGLMPFQSSQLGYDRYGSDYDQYIWDDFTLASTTSITELRWRGVYVHGGYYGPAIDFLVSFWPSIPLLTTEPDVVGGPLREVLAGNNANETPAVAPGRLNRTFHDYRFVLPAPFVAMAGEHYWIQIEAIQPGPTDWGFVKGSGGNSSCFASIPGQGDYMFYRLGADAAFTLMDATM